MMILMMISVDQTAIRQWRNFKFACRKQQVVPPGESLCKAVVKVVL